jgi:hypothetical protein
VGCTEDLCLSNDCFNIPESNLCCGNAGDCDDLNACTLDRCIGNLCAHTFLASQDCSCTSWLDCDDGLPCTSGTCKNGTCIYEMAAVGPSCCAAAADCDDGLALTVDSCLQFTCNQAPMSPCFEDAGCDDGDPCTADSCDIESPCPAEICDGWCNADECGMPVGFCVSSAVDGCCTVDGQCDDGLPGTEDRCVDYSCFHFLGAGPKACAAVETCDDGNACTLQECVAGLCTYSLAPSVACCATSQTCDDGDACSVDQCTSFTCQHEPAQGPVVHVHWGFPQPVLPPGFSATSDGSSVKWQVSGKRFVTSPYSLYFGDISGPSIDNGKKVQGTLLTDWVTLPSGLPISLQFWLFLGVEPLYSVDQLTILIDDGGTLVPVFDKTMIGGSTGGAWKQVALNLAPFAGKKVRLEIRFDSIDALNNSGEGVYIDDIDWSWPCVAW